MGQTYGFLFTNYYPELLRKHKAQGDIAITNSEIATVEQWAKNLDSMGCNQQQKDVIISKAFLQMLERLAMPLNSYGLDLAEHCISCPPA